MGSPALPRITSSMARQHRKTQKMSEDPLFKKQVYSMLNLKYKFGFMKGASTLLMTLIILLLVFGIVFNCNVMSVVIFLSIAFLLFKDLSYKSLLAINMVIVVVLIVQYGIAITNLGPKNSPMHFPVPFDDISKLRRIGIPWYSTVEFFTIANNKWAYYFSLMISHTQIHNLWFLSMVMILINIYFTNFYSTIFNKNIEISNVKNIKDIIRIQSDVLVRKYEEVIKSQELGELSDLDPFVMRDITDNEIDKILSMFYASSWMIKIYSASINAVCSIGGLLVLIFLLMITFDQTGILNLVYILFCLYHIFNFRKFFKPEEYTLPKHLKYIKFFIYFDLLINIAYQVPLTKLHQSDNHNEWQKVIGVFPFCRVNDETGEMRFTNVNAIVTKAIMF